MNPSALNTVFNVAPLAPTSLGRLVMAAEAITGSLRRSGDAKVKGGERTRWQAPGELPEAPGPAEVLPALPSKRLKIVCLSRDDDADLSERVRATCRDQAGQGLRLTSTFSHDGSVFLVFKKRA